MGLRKDLDNCLYHRLGHHSNCAAYFCTGSKANSPLNLIPEAENGGILREMKNCISRLVLNAERLIENKTNHLCEQFNTIINKHVAGKRLNFSGRRSYNTRVEAAVISFNLNHFLRKIHRQMANNNPGWFVHQYIR